MQPAIDRNGRDREEPTMSQAVAPAGVRWRLGAGTRKSVLLIHIASAGAWLGIDVVMAVLVFTAVLSDDDRTKALSFQALELIAVWPLLVTGPGLPAHRRPARAGQQVRAGPVLVGG